MFDWLPWIFVGALAFFGLGWLVARIDIKQLLLESRALPQSYFRGLNFLLNEQQDKAIEAFIEVTDANPEAVELRFALASLFRKRGEVDRAIRLHQALSERSSLGPEGRTMALIELAQDYQKAGLLDHAERILVDIRAKSAGTPAQQQDTLRLLQEVYVQERAWDKAIAIAETRGGQGGDEDQRNAMIRAEFHCERAIQEKKSGQPDVADAQLRAALQANARCVRASLLAGEWRAAEGRHVDAIEAWQQIEKQDPAYVGLVADAMLASYTALGRHADGFAELKRLQQTFPALDLLSALFRSTLENEGAQAAVDLVKSDLHRHPTLVGLDRLLEAQLQVVGDDRKADVGMVKDLVHAHASRLAVYLCHDCGFKAKQYYWQCPACGGWETFPPRLTAEYESAGRHLAHAQVENSMERAA